MEKNIIDAIETKLGYEFKDNALLLQAFTRESYAKEQRVKGLDVQSNEQLEYFGDSVLNYLVVCGQLDNFTKVMDGTGLHVLYKEGKLSEFNSHWTDKTMLSQCIDALGFAQYLIMSKGDINQKANENKSVKEDLFESLVGAMWIDSDKDISRIQNVVYSMLNIQFKSANVEKNYYSQFMEFADKYKCRTLREVTEIENGFEVELGLNMEDYLGAKDEGFWTKTGYGRNIKEAEVNAAENLINFLNEYSFFDMKNRLPKKDYEEEKAINVLQELNQQGYIGEISYEEEACFTSERKPYWKVTCTIANYLVKFIGTDDSKKKAKKKAAHDACAFIYLQYNRTDSNPQNKMFKFVLNKTNDDGDLHVFVVDSYQEFLAKGIMYPENVEDEIFMLSNYMTTDGNEYEIFDDPQEYLYCIITGYPMDAPTDWIGDRDRKLKLFIKEEFDKLSDEVKTNGVLLREALIDMKNRANY